MVAARISMSRKAHEMKLSWSYVVALILAGVGFLALLLLAIMMNKNPFDLNIIGQYGSFVGGFVGSVFSLAGFLLLFEALIQQQRLFHSQQFESNFFNLLNLHRENVAQLRKRLPIQGDKYEEGRRVFVELRKEYGEILEIVRRTDASLSTKLSAKEIANITYLVLYYGVGETVFGKGQNETSILKDRISKLSYDNEFCKVLIEACRKCMDSDNTYIKFNGNQSRLGHYYRHLLQLVKFVDNSKHLTIGEKRSYVEIVRAQLSSHEQLLLFYFAISILGRSWLVDPNLILKYELIKNILWRVGLHMALGQKTIFR
jgi:hypothetical protein